MRGNRLRSRVTRCVRHTRSVQQARSRDHRTTRCERQKGRIDRLNQGRSKRLGMTLLSDHVPLSLLHDLWSPQGPESWEIFAVEAGWLDPRSLDRVELTGV